EYDPAELKFGEFLSYAAGVATLDPSIGRKEKSDRSGYDFVIRAQPSDGSLPRFYIESVSMERHSFQERINTIKGLVSGRSRERPATRVRVETISGFADIGERIAANVAVPTDLVDHVLNKLTNLEKHSALFENKRVFINKNIAPAIKEELT